MGHSLLMANATTAAEQAAAIGRGNAYEAIDQVQDYDSREDAYHAYLANMRDTVHEQGLGAVGLSAAWDAFAAALTEEGWLTEDGELVREG